MNDFTSLDDIWAEQMKDPEFRRIDRRLRPSFDIAGTMLDAMKLRGLSQLDFRELARKSKMPVKMWRDVYGAEGDPTLADLVKIADALDAHIEIRIVPNDAS